MVMSTRKATTAMRKSITPLPGPRAGRGAPAGRPARRRPAGGPAVGVEHVLHGGIGDRRRRLHRLPHQGRDLVEAAGATQEGVDTDLVGRVEHGRHDATPLAGPPGHPDGREAPRVEGQEVEGRERGQVGRRGDAREPLPVGECQGDRDAHVGTPSWALVAPSRNSTIEWITEPGCTSTSMRRYSTSKRKWASMTSSPLFIMVALSMVTLGPCSRSDGGAPPRE